MTLKGAIWWAVVAKRAMATLVMRRQVKRRRFGNVEGVGGITGEMAGRKNAVKLEADRMWRRGRRG